MRSVANINKHLEIFFLSAYYTTTNGRDERPESHDFGTPLGLDGLRFGFEPIPRFCPLLILSLYPVPRYKKGQTKRSALLSFLRHSNQNIPEIWYTLFFNNGMGGYRYAMERECHYGRKDEVYRSLA